MEQLNEFYDPNVAEPYLSLDESSQRLGLGGKQGLDQQTLNRFIQKLLTTIDLPKLTEVYFQQLTSTLPLSGIKIQFEDTHLALGQWLENSHSKTLKCKEDKITLASMGYSLTQPLSLRDWQILQQMHMHFCYPFKNALEHHKIKQFAMKDFLTSLGNRASYNESMVRLVNQAQRSGNPFGLLILDMDNFKQVNDVHGHHTGDEVLLACASTIQNCLRDSDFAFRFGGDEFCCLLPDADSPINGLIAERIRQAILHHPLLQLHNISCSIGSATFETQDSPIGLFSRADQALYEAKKGGKNCTRAA
ncbi:GGDEF domain-containing protein [Paraglaciecola aestuariivivens]